VKLITLDGKTKGPVALSIVGGRLDVFAGQNATAQDMQQANAGLSVGRRIC